MGRRRLVLNEESCDEMEAVEKVQWSWKREALQTTTESITLYSRRSIVDQIAVELKLSDDRVYQEFMNSCFGFLTRSDTQGFCSRAALHCLFAREVIKADAGPDELWYRVGGRFIRFSKYEYALVTGLSFGPTSFDPSAEHHPPASGLFSRHYQGQRLKMDTLRSDFTDGVFRESPADALKVAKLLVAYFLLFGLDGTQTYIDEWAWTLIEDTDQWETFMWGKYTYQILLTYLQRVPTELLQAVKPSYRVCGYVWAFLIWAFEAIPELGNVFGVHTSEDVLPRCLRWKLQKAPVALGEFFDRQMEVHTTLESSAEEKRQPYWKHIHDDLRSGVCYIHPYNRIKKRTLSANPSSLRDEIPKRSARGLIQKKMQALVQKELPSVVHLPCGVAMNNPLSPKSGAKSSTCQLKLYKKDAMENNASRFLKTDEIRNIEGLRTRSDFFIDSELELPNVIVDQAGRNKLVFELNEKINELNRNLENERLLEVYQERCKRLDIQIGNMGKEIEELRHEKLAYIETVKELRHERLAAIKSVEELRLIQLDADKVLEELKRKNLEASLKLLESDKAVELYKSRLENLSPKIMKTEKMDDLDIRNFKGRKYNSGNGSTPEDYEHRNARASDDSDESCTDSRMDDFITSLRSKSLDRKWMYEADMLRALQKDEQLCMNAVCALYRQHVVARKSNGRSNNGGFAPVDSMSGCALSEYLIDGDGELRLRKSLSEVKKERPDVIAQCRKLATIYVDKLFAIYCAADDPFFGPS